MASRSEYLQNTQKYEINCMGEPSVSLNDVKISSHKRSIILHQHQQQVIPEEISPYVTSQTLSNRLYALKNPTKCNTGLIGEKIMSAKIIKMKELESDLNLRRNQLNEVIAENRVLKALQRRQEHALKTYEQSKEQLPQLIQSHSEEIKVLKSKCKKMSTQNRDLEKKLREREAELQTLQDQHRHLLKLSKDRNLGEREKLQEEVTYLKKIVESMDVQLQELSRKKAIENKVHQQQIQQEISRSKECRKALFCAEKQIHRLEEMLKLCGKNITTEKMSGDFSKMMKVSSAALGQRLPSITQNLQGGELDKSIKKEIEVNPKPTKAVEKRIDLSIKSSEEEEQIHPKSKMSITEICKSKNESKPPHNDPMISREYYQMSIERRVSRGWNGSESQYESAQQINEEINMESVAEVNSISEEGEKTIEISRESPTIKETEKSLGKEVTEIDQKEQRIDSSKRAELLRALREMDAKESSDSDAEEIDFSPSTSYFRSNFAQKSPLKSNCGEDQHLLVEERRHSTGNSSSKINDSSSVRKTIKSDLMHELFIDQPSSETKLPKEKYPDTSRTFLKEIGS